MPLSNAIRRAMGEARISSAGKVGVFESGVGVALGVGLGVGA